MAGKYPLAIRVIHWLMAILVISLLIVGLVMSDLAKEDELRPTLYMLHKSFGVVLLLLLGLRIVLRLKLGVPALPEAIAPRERVLAHLGHGALYLVMLAMPLSGYLMSNSFGHSVYLFGLELPKLVSPDRDFGKLMHELHEFGGFALIGLVLVHVGALAKHYLVEKVNLLQRMI